MLICIGDGIRDSLIKVYVYSPIIRYFLDVSFNRAVMSCLLYTNDAADHTP